LVFLVHGLVETERRWVGTAAAPGLAGVIEARSPVSPVLIRYNTGLPLDRNGARLADLIQEVVDGWPLAVESISLVGYSMGGLVAGKACLAAATSHRPWVDRLTDVITIGAPHGGAPLEKLVAAASWGLNMAATTRPLAAFLHGRSQGIKDLGSGAGAAPPPALERLKGVRHHLVGGVLTSNPSNPLGAIVGDLMVGPGSSTSSVLIEPTSAVILGGVHHFNLLEDPAVVEHVASWLDPTGGRCATLPPIARPIVPRVPSPVPPLRSR
jgi:pimeloyl-ACP methyl ester carboxylesterase